MTSFILGLECYIRLDLAKHCQEEYCAEESEFGFYHFREVQRDANGLPQVARPPSLPPLPQTTLQQQLSRPPPPLPLTLRRKSFSMQKRRTDSERFGSCAAIKGKENKFGWKLLNLG